MRDLNEIQCFVKAVELKSLTAAAKSLGLPKSSVSRKIANLEKRLGMTLLVRTTRALNLTDAGREFYQTAVAALHEIESAEEGLDHSRHTVEGLLRITGPVEFANGSFPQLIASFLNAHPLVKIDLVLTNRVVDLVVEGYDLAFRLGPPKDSSLMSKALKHVNAQVFASPEFLKKRGEPETIARIEDHEWVNFSPRGASMRFTITGPEGERSFTPCGRFSANHMATVKQAAISGLGFAVIPTFMAENEIKNNSLKVVCSSWQVRGGPIHMLFPAQKFRSRKLRHFIDFTVDNFTI
jgi:DNA-binding transcriptional LysR family regulator